MTDQEMQERLDRAFLCSLEFETELRTGFPLRFYLCGLFIMASCLAVAALLLWTN